jgi:formylglycine-generating enzyme required for sulfatase activity
MKGLIAGLLIVGYGVVSVEADFFGNGTNAFEIDFALMGNAGNIADTNGYGDVAYNYKIGRYEVTVEQFSKARNLDNNISNGDEDHWESELGEWAPAVNVSWQEAAKFCNWLTSGDAFAGAYTVSGGVVMGVDRASAISTYGLVYVIPTEDEWYKAAYHTGSGYSMYANGTDTIPEKGPEGANYDYYYPYPGKPWLAWEGAGEHNATHNMNGNLWEICEDGVDLLIRGGAFDEPPVGRKDKHDKSFEAIEVGFRVATVGSGITTDRFVDNMGFTKTQLFDQMDASTTAPAGATFYAWVSGDYLTAYYPSGPVNFVGPGGAVSMPFNGNKRWWDAEYASVAAMKSALPNGSYTLNLAGTNVTLNLSPESYPIIPVCTSTAGTWNSGRLQISTVDAAAGFTLSANDGDTAGGFLSIQLYDADYTVDLEAFETQWAASEISLSIPAGELKPGATYIVEVEFDNGVDNADAGHIDPGAWSHALYSSRTSFEIEVVAPSPPVDNFSGGDDFNDNSVDWGKWDLPEQGWGTMNETNGRLEFWGHTDESSASWIANAGSYTQDWAVVVDAHNADDNRIAGMYVSFGPSNSWINIEHHRNADITSRHAVISGFSLSDDPDADFYEFSQPITNDTVALCLAFDSESKTIYSAFDAVRGFVVVTRFNIADLGMSSGDTFAMGLYAGTESGVNVTPGTLYFDNFAATPNASVLDDDDDGDGLGSLAEYIAGTNPTNGNSRFAVSNSGPTPSGYVLNWNAIEGRVYTVEWTDHLTNGFQTLESNIAYPQNSYTDTVHSAEEGGFYSLKVELEN